MIIDVLNPSLGLLLKLEQSESPLYDGRLLHKEPKLSVGSVCLVHTPVLLDSYGCEFRPPRTFEHPGWNLYHLAHIVFIRYAIIELLVARLSHICRLTFCQVHKRFAVNVGKINAEGC
jgi:hypothetical protein